MKSLWNSKQSHCQEKVNQNDQMQICNPHLNLLVPDKVIAKMEKQMKEEENDINFYT